MAYEILEAVRRSLVADTDVHALIGDKIYPADNRLVERLSTGQIPLVAFSMSEEAQESCGRYEGTVQIEVIHRALEKKTLWDIHKAVEAAVTPRLLQFASDQTPDLLIRIGLFRQRNAQDDLFDEATDSHRLRSLWRTLYARTTT